MSKFKTFISNYSISIAACALTLMLVGVWHIFANPTKTIIGDDVIIAGKLGIGTTAPGSPLHILSNSANAVQVTGSSTNSLGYLVSNTVASGRSWSFGSSGGGPSPVGTFFLYDNTASANRLVVNASGNVGIGTTSPAGELHVRRSALAGGSPRSDVLVLETGSGSSFVHFLAPKSGESGLLMGTEDGQIAAGVLRRSGTEGLSFRTGGNVDRVRIDADGNVGIGTTGPTSKLHVIGTFTATGTKSATVKTESFGDRMLYAMESAEVRFYDEGKGNLESGKATIELDPVWLETIEGEFYVYLTAEGDSNGLYVAEKGKDYFVVKENNGGESNVEFSWMISARRLGYGGMRLEQPKEE